MNTDQVRDRIAHSIESNTLHRLAEQRHVHVTVRRGDQHHVTLIYGDQRVETTATAIATSVINRLNHCRATAQEPPAGNAEGLLRWWLDTRPAATSEAVEHGLAAVAVTGASNPQWQVQVHRRYGTGVWSGTNGGVRSAARTRSCSRPVPVPDFSDRSLSIWSTVGEHPPTAHLAQPDAMLSAMNNPVPDPWALVTLAGQVAIGDRLVIDRLAGTIWAQPVAVFTVDQTAALAWTDGGAPA